MEAAVALGALVLLAKSLPSSSGNAPRSDTVSPAAYQQQGLQPQDMSGNEQMRQAGFWQTWVGKRARADELPTQMPYNTAPLTPSVYYVQQPRAPLVDINGASSVLYDVNNQLTPDAKENMRRQMQNSLPRETAFRGVYAEHNPEREMRRMPFFNNPGMDGGQMIELSKETVRATYSKQEVVQPQTTVQRARVLL